MNEEGKRYSESTTKALPQTLNSRHRALMRLLIAGTKLSDAAKELGYNVTRASLVSNSGIFKEEMEKMRKEVDAQFVDAEAVKVHVDRVRTRLGEEALASVETLVSLRDSSESDLVRKSSASDLLDRSGFKTPLQVEGKVAVVEIGDGLANALREALAEMKDGQTNGDGSQPNKIAGEK